MIREPRLQLGQGGVEVRGRGGRRRLGLRLRRDRRRRADGLRLLHEEEAADGERDDQDAGSRKTGSYEPLSAAAAGFLSVGSVAPMRRLLLLVAVLVFVDTMLYAALTPLLPHFAHELHLSKARAGTLVAAYAAGALVGRPARAAGRRRSSGARRAVLVGLSGMGLASLGFAFAGSFSTLFLARFLQGLGSAFTWAGSFAWLLAAAPRERRGELIGSAMGAAVFGALFGPVIGAAAALAGRAVIFCALAGLSVVLAVWTLRLGSAPPAEVPSFAASASRASQPATRRRPRADVGAVAAVRDPLGARPAASVACGLGRRSDRRRLARRCRPRGDAGADRRADQRPPRPARAGARGARRRRARVARSRCRRRVLSSTRR